MNDATAERAKKTGKKAVQKADDPAKRSDRDTALDRRYGEIGISAVAAAARYQGGGRNPAYAPVPNPPDERIEEAA